MRPTCYNRKPRDEGRWIRVGWDYARQKPVFRFLRPWFVDRCTTIETDPAGANYARNNGFNCEGCRWYRAQT